MENAAARAWRLRSPPGAASIMGRGRRKAFRRSRLGYPVLVRCTRLGTDHARAPRHDKRCPDETAVGQAIRHHLVSRGYLRAWRPNGEKQRVLVRVLPSVDARLVGIADICVKTHWLSITELDGSRTRIIEKSLSQLESDALPHLRTLAKTGRVDPASRVAVGYLLSTLSIRGTTIRQALRDEGVAIGEGYLRANPSAEDAVRWEQEQIRTGSRALETLVLVLGPLTASMLTSMQWRIYRDPRGGFATADQPIIYRNSTTGTTAVSPIDNENIDAAFVALSPSDLLVGSWGAGPDPAPEEAPPGLVIWFNSALYAQTDTHFIEPPSGDAILSHERVDFPDLGLTNDGSRLSAAWKGVRATEKADDPGVIIYTQWVKGGFRLYTTGQ